jgi:hypothetical protein
MIGESCEFAGGVIPLGDVIFDKVKREYLSSVMAAEANDIRRLFSVVCQLFRRRVSSCETRWLCGACPCERRVLRSSVEVRAFGGCLGAKRRRRTWHAAKSCGERRALADPQISEWGNPSREGDPGLNP